MIEQLQPVEYHTLADELLENLADDLYNASSEIDAEYLQGILNIKLPDGKQYVINKHGPTQQIWLSSPFSSAAKFSYENGVWKKPDGTELIALLKKEFADIGVYISL